jgi:hypothetical protein
MSASCFLSHMKERMDISIQDNPPPILFPKRD